MLAAQYNSANLVSLLKTVTYLTSKHIMISPRFGSCLTKAIKYNPKDVRHILDSKLLTEDILYSREEDEYNGSILSMNIVQLACKYNPEALMFLLASKYDMSVFVSEIIGKSQDKVNSLKLAILYQPDAVEVLLKSKYGVNDLVKNTNNIMIVSCLVDCLTYQPASFQVLLKSGKMDHDDIYYKKDPFNELQKLNYNFPLLDAKTDINKSIPLMKHINERCDQTDPRVCTICSTFKNKVIFSPCDHYCCVSCAMRLDKCHICRTYIEEKFVVNF